MKEEPIELHGKVIDVLPNNNFKVQTEDMEILAYLSGRLRKYKIKIVLGDEVTLEVSPYDLTRGRITYRK